MSFESRKEAVCRLAVQLSDSDFSEELVNAYVKDTGYSRKSVFDNEVKVAQPLLYQVGVDTSFTSSCPVDLANIGPLGEVAVMLPHNGINIATAKAVCSSYMIGNNTLVKFPSGLESSSDYYKQLMLDNLSDIRFAPKEQTGEEFLYACLASPSVKAIVVYHNYEWLASCKNEIRRRGKKIIFEGRGKDPMIVLSDADLAMAVNDAVACMVQNAGQECSGTERFFVHQDVEAAFVERLSERLSRIRIGHPHDDAADLAPVKSDVSLNRMIGQVIDARHRGGHVHMGGRPMAVGDAGELAFLPTIVTNCNTQMLITREVNSGPLFPIISFSSIEDLLFKVDQSDYGLNASVYGAATEELKDCLYRGHRSLYINSTISSRVNSPSRIMDGGFRNSGFVWEWKKGQFIHSEGRRLLLKELSIQEQ